MPTGYPIPQKAIFFEQEIKKSRFLVFTEPVSTPADVKTRLKQLKSEYPDARHHCYAYICGKPNQTTLLGCSDDGEPSGTAGGPMLNVLQHKGIGDILIVVVRYFGGTKLGTGGLVRAYSSSAQLAIEQLSIIQKVEYISCPVQFPYSLESQIRHFLKEHSISILQTEYTDVVILNIQVEASNLEELQTTLIEFTNNQVIFPS